MEKINFFPRWSIILFSGYHSRCWRSPSFMGEFHAVGVFILINGLLPTQSQASTRSFPSGSLRFGRTSLDIRMRPSLNNKHRNSNIILLSLNNQCHCLVKYSATSPTIIYHALSQSLRAQSFGEPLTEISRTGLDSAVWLLYKSKPSESWTR